MTVIIFVLLLIASYLFGSIPAAYLVAKYRRGIDIRQYGSGQMGASNVRRTLSMKYAIPVALFDFFKGMLMVIIARKLGMGLDQQVFIGLAAITGHNWPVFLRFNGGRGVASSMGVALYLIPWGIPVFAAIVAFSLLLKSTPLPVLVAMGALPLLSWRLESSSMEITLGLLAIFLLMVFRRLTAPLSDISSSVKRSELLFYRLLFDRDIKDKRAWIYRKPIEDKPSESHDSTEMQKKE